MYGCVVVGALLVFWIGVHEGQMQYELNLESQIAAAGPKTIHANRPYLVNRNVAMRDRFKYFDAMATPAVTNRSHIC